MEAHIVKVVKARQQWLPTVQRALSLGKRVLLLHGSMLEKRGVLPNPIVDILLGRVTVPNSAGQSDLRAEVVTAEVAGSSPFVPAINLKDKRFMATRSIRNPATPERIE
jgi:hypothetical protein